MKHFMRHNTRSCVIICVLITDIELNWSSTSDKRTM